MKKIEAIIKPFRLQNVKAALNRAGIELMTISEVKRFDSHTAHTEMYRGSEYVVDSSPQFKIELILPNDRFHSAIAAIAGSHDSAKTNEDKVFVYNVDEAICFQS